MGYKDIKTNKFGDHLIVDAYGCDEGVLASKEACENILSHVADLAEMHKLLEPVVVEASPNTAVGGKDPGGYSGFVIIQESHISIHTFAKRGFVTMDVYSCKEFDHNAVIDYLKEVFKAQDLDIIKFERGLKYPVDNIY